MFNFRDEESFIYTKDIKLLAIGAAITLILVFIVDDRFAILEEVFRLIAIICQAMILIFLGTKVLIMKRTPFMVLSKVS